MAPRQLGNVMEAFCVLPFKFVVIGLPESKWKGYSVVEETMVATDMKVTARLAQTLVVGDELEDFPATDDQIR